MEERKKCSKCGKYHGCRGTRGPRGYSGLPGVQGPQGPQGLRGERGPRGYMGFQGAIGATGANGIPGKDGKNGAPGPPGIAGKDGEQGLPGLDGKDGERGLPGLDGKDGERGLPGLDGKDGERGLPGLVGAQGPAGPKGDSGGIAEFAYIYNTSLQKLLENDTLTFNTNGFLTDGFIHTEGRPGILIEKAGIYEIIFHVSAVQPNKFTLFVDGKPISDKTFCSNTENLQNSGLTILSLESNSELMLRNTSQIPNVDLQNSTVLEETIINATLTIKKLA